MVLLWGSLIKRVCGPGSVHSGAQGTDRSFGTFEPTITCSYCVVSKFPDRQPVCFHTAATLHVHDRFWSVLDGSILSFELVSLVFHFSSTPLCIYFPRRYSILLAAPPF